MGISDKTGLSSVVSGFLTWEIWYFMLFGLGIYGSDGIAPFYRAIVPPGGDFYSD